MLILSKEYLNILQLDYLIHYFYYYFVNTVCFISIYDISPSKYSLCVVSLFSLKSVGVSGSEPYKVFK